MLPPLPVPSPPHTHPFPPSALQPITQPTHHPLLPYTHPLVSCPYLGRDVLSARWRGGGGRRGREGGRWVDTREAGGETVSTRSPFLIRTCLEFRPLSLGEELLFCGTSHERTLASTRSSIEVDRSVVTSSPVCCSSQLAVQEEVCGVFSAIIGDKQ